MKMKRSATLRASGPAFRVGWLLSLAFALLASNASAATSENPYIHTITNRNVFALKAPPDLNQPPPPPPPNVPAVKLAGITTIMGGKRAIVRVPRPASPPVPAGESSLILAEGAPAEGGIQVLQINIAEASVRIDNNGTAQTLTLEKDAPKASPASVAPGIPVPTGQPGVIPAPPVPNSAGMASSKSEELPYRTVEEQEVLIELERDRTAGAVAAGELPPLPPTSLQQEF